MTTATGQAAEAAVTKYLTSQVFKIIDRNWRTRVCEIDIIAQKDKTIYFVEVKYRTQHFQGDGFDYITPKKLKQMQFAAELWVQQNNWSGDWRLAAAAVTGYDYDQIELLEIA
jgi:uncharacterized protein (TIGR00252 family)